MTSHLAWDELVRDVPERGIEREREATPEERASLAATLDLVSLHRLWVTYRATPIGTGRYALAGRLEASVVQTCVVSLEPVASEIRQEIEASFWPADEVPQPTGGAVDIEDEPDPEPIVDGRLAVGRIVFEGLAAAIDPFPRGPGAKLDWQPDPAVDSKADSPFAALARIKKG